LLRRASLLSEVGLDGRSSVGLAEQRRVMSAALDIHDELPCFASVHSAGRTAEVVDLLSRHRCSTVILHWWHTVILHWWRGSRDETREAVKLGCYFSFYPRDAKRGSILDIVPVGRVLAETDHPYGDLGQAVSAPGATAAVEARLNPTNPGAARLQVWSNFRRLAEEAGVMDRLPNKIAGLALAAPRS
jgi:TatD DNase family protein